MAGKGPAPKENRRRRNVPARGEWADLQPLDKPVLPVLPKASPLRHPETDADIGWPVETRDLWNAWRRDPVTSQWSPADVAYAFDTIRIHAVAPWKMANEIRLRMDALGLTPKGKRDLRWRVAADGDEREDEKPKLAPVRRLRAVDPAGA
jgi:hypothetical protein